MSRGGVPSGAPIRCRSPAAQLLPLPALAKTLLCWLSQQRFPSSARSSPAAFARTRPLASGSSRPSDKARDAMERIRFHKPSYRWHVENKQKRRYMQSRRVWHSELEVKALSYASSASSYRSSRHRAEPNTKLDTAKLALEVQLTDDLWILTGCSNPQGVGSCMSLEDDTSERYVPTRGDIELGRGLFAFRRCCYCLQRPARSRPVEASRAQGYQTQGWFCTRKTRRADRLVVT